MSANLALLQLESKGLHRCLTVSLYFMELPEIWYRQRILFKSQIILRKIKSLPQSVAKLFYWQKEQKNVFSIMAFQVEISGKKGQIATCASCEGCLLSKNCQALICLYKRAVKSWLLEMRSWLLKPRSWQAGQPAFSHNTTNIL